MIIRILSAGKSYKGLGLYLSRDAGKALTSERVDWTQTLNLANDHVDCAIDEMYHTYRAAEQLKREAGIRSGTHALKNAVKHISLGWHASDPQTREHMIEASQAFLDHMGWGEHQAILFCHNDKDHQHVHIMLSCVNPNDGRALRTWKERQKAQAFGLAYERAQGKIFCEQRLLPEDQREPAPTRDAWLTMKEAERQHDKVEVERITRTPDYLDRNDPATWQAKEWDALKSHQRAQRDQFFAGGKQAFKEVRNAVFREVRTEFRDQWKMWFQLRREGGDLALLYAIKDGILKRQNAELANRGDPACAGLREQRDETYKQLLQDQKDERAWLRARQKEGRRSPELLDLLYRDKGPDRREKLQAKEERPEGFRSAGQELCAERKPAAGLAPHTKRKPFKHKGKERHRVRDPVNAAGDLGMGAIGAVATVFERLFESMLLGESAPPPRQAPTPEAPSKRDRRDELARTTEKQMRATEAQASEAEQLQASWEERNRRRGRHRGD